MKSNFMDKMKENKKIVTLIAFAVIVLAVILIATLALREFVVPVCIAIIIETAIANLLKKSELWLHGVVVIVQVVAGLLIRRFPFIILCAIIYVAATVALMLIHKNSDVKNVEGENNKETKTEE